jgi:hypothetical protein
MDWIDVMPVKPKNPPVKPLPSPLVDRAQAAEILHVAAITVRRIEADKRLTPVRLREGRCSKTFYRKHEVYALIGVEMPAVIDA